MSETFTMKTSLGAEAVGRIAAALRRAAATFDARSFTRDACHGLDELELKARVAHVVRALDAHLPSDLHSALDLAVRAVRDPAIRGDGDDTFSIFSVWPLIDWVPHRALDAPAAALDALALMTSAFSAEFAIRPFIVAHRELTLRTLRRWTRHGDEHVRRLVSESTRPRLPWARALPDFKRDPSPTIPLLFALRDDPSEYVRRSVANHLNDIGKDHPDRLVALADQWMRDAPEPRQRLLEHALRSLIKKGDPGAMQVLGFSTTPRLSGRLSLSSGKLQLGQALEIEIELCSRANVPQRFVVDFAVHYRKASGALSPKVFKLRDVELAPGETLQLTKRLLLIHRSTRRLHGGEHAVELLVAGRSATTLPFVLEL